MKYLSRALIAFHSIIMSLCVMSCENLMFIDAAQLYRVSFETNGGTEIEAYRTYKRIKGGKKNIFKAYIKRDLVFNVPFIDTYEIIEVIR